MPDAGKVLIADDEQTFLEATTELLRSEGYDCHSVSDAVQAAAALEQSKYDVLIADIKMPGNADLELIQRLPELAGSMPVILVTGYPTGHTAVQSINLPVVAYLIKPVDFEQLLSMVKAAVEYSRIQRAVSSTRTRLNDWQQNLKQIETTMGGAAPLRTDASGSINAFLQLTHANILQTFGDLLNVAQALTTHAPTPVVCHLMDCPRLTLFSNAIDDAVKTLERTKSSFKSKELGELRKRLEDLLESERNHRPGQ
jgi:DNA-binding response OmpR family regulator